MVAADKVFAGSIPEIYERFLVPLIFESYARDLAERLAGTNPQYVLETAARTGVLMRAIASRLPMHARIVATDLNQPMLDHARMRLSHDSRIEWRQADALALPFADQMFDAVTCQFGVMFFPDKLQGYKETRRVLRPGGYFFFNVWDRKPAERTGALHVTGSAESGYSFPGSRIFEWQYRCAMDLFAMVPSASDQSKSVKQEIAEFNERAGWYNKSRLVDHGARILSSTHLALTIRQKVQFIKLLLTPEFLLDGKQFKDCVSPDFFETNLWYIWSSMMAIVPEHSAIEIRRYFLRFFHLLPDISTMTMFLRTKYNQRQAIVEPMVKWLANQGVNFAVNAPVRSIAFKSTRASLTVTALQVMKSGEVTTVDVYDDDFVMVTNGSQLSDLGSMTTPPQPKTVATGRAFALWNSLAHVRNEFGNPKVFAGNIDHSTWISFTVTCRDALFAGLMEKFSGREAGRGGLISFKHSNWLITIVTFHQPNVLAQPPDAFVWWGYGIYPNRTGNFVKKRMADCSGAELLREVLMHLGFESSADAIIKSSICIPCLLPFAGSVFMPRKRKDRPPVVPKGSTNFAFIGQFCEQPDDVIFTMEYSVRSAWTAVHKLLGTRRKPPPVYKGYLSPRTLWRVLRVVGT